MDNESIIALDKAHVSPASRLPFPPLVPESGVGCELTDADGRTFLDLHAMACVANVGYQHPRVVGAICDQAQRLTHINPGYAHHELMARLAERLSVLAPIDGETKVAFGLSGADANDTALKLVRSASGRTKVISFFDSYHGNTYGALSLSAVSPAMRSGFGPVVPDVFHVPYPHAFREGRSDDDVSQTCLAWLDQLLSSTAPASEVAAIFLEPIQGDSGVVVPPPAYVEGLKARCERHGILLVAEEVQTGMGRTGHWFASNYVDIRPDVLILGKALGSGMPVSAVVSRSELMDSWKPPAGGASTSGNPVCMAAALATIEVIEQESLLANATAMGAMFVEGFQQMADEHDTIGDIRGTGLLLGIELVSDRATRERARLLTSQVLVACYDRGLYLTSLAGNVLRICPPLVVGSHEVTKALEIISEAFKDARTGRVSEDRARSAAGW